MGDQERRGRKVIPTETEIRWAEPEIELIASYIKSLVTERGQKPKDGKSGMSIRFIEGVHPYLGEFGAGADIYDGQIFLRQKMAGRPAGIGFGFLHQGCLSPLTAREADLTMEFLKTAIGSGNYRILLSWDTSQEWSKAEGLERVRTQTHGGVKLGEHEIPLFYTHEVYFNGLEEYFNQPLTKAEEDEVLAAFNRALRDPGTSGISFRLMHN